MTDGPQDAGFGSLSRNDRRTKPSHPEFTGRLEIHGQKYRLAAWVKEKDGRKYFSIAVREEHPAAPSLASKLLEPLDGGEIPSDALAVLEENSGATTAWGRTLTRWSAV